MISIVFGPILHTHTHTPTTSFMISTTLRTKTSIYLKILVFYICFFYVKFSEDNLMKIETCRSTSGLYVKVCILIFAHFFVIIYETVH